MRPARHHAGRGGRRRRVDDVVHLGEPRDPGGRGAGDGTRRDGRRDADGVCAHVQPAVADARVRPRQADAPPASRGRVQATARDALSGRDGRGDGDDAAARARHAPLCVLRVQARRQRVPGLLGKGPAVQRGGAVSEHARDHGRRAVRAHALRQALLGRAAHGGVLGGRRRGARDRAARD